MTTDYEALIEPVKSKRTFEEVSDRLKELIFSGALKPGQQLPAEPALAQLFHVGRQSVREALRVLEISGFITVRPGVKGGAVIQSTMLSRLANLFLETVKLHQVSLEDCFAARRAIEAALLDLVIRNATSEDIETLRGNIMAARRKLHANSPAYEDNIDFHRLLAKASKNHTFAIVMESIMAVFCDLKSRNASVDLGDSREVANLHEAIVDAVAAKDLAVAERILKEDLAVAERILAGAKDTGKASKEAGKQKGKNPRPAARSNGRRILGR